MSPIDTPHRPWSTRLAIFSWIQPKTWAAFSDAHFFTYHQMRLIGCNRPGFSPGSGASAALPLALCWLSDWLFSPLPASPPLLSAADAEVFASPIVSLSL